MKLPPSACGRAVQFSMHFSGGRRDSNLCILRSEFATLRQSVEYPQSGQRPGKRPDDRPDGREEDGVDQKIKGGGGGAAATGLKTRDTWRRTLLRVRVFPCSGLAVRRRGLLMGVGEFMGYFALGGDFQEGSRPAAPRPGFR